MGIKWRTTEFSIIRETKVIVFREFKNFISINIVIVLIFLNEGRQKIIVLYNKLCDSVQIREVHDAGFMEKISNGIRENVVQLLNLVRLSEVFRGYKDIFGL